MRCWMLCCLFFFSVYLEKSLLIVSDSGKNMLGVLIISS